MTEARRIETVPLHPLRVLLVEDSVDDATLLLTSLRRAGYEPQYRRVDSAPAMQAALAQEAWDVVLSDYQLPNFGGLEALAVLRESKLDLPFIIVSGTIGEDIAVEAMRTGAHDYLMKDNLTRLGPAIARELREAEVRWERHRAAVTLQEDAHVFEALARVGRELIAYPKTAGLLSRLCQITIDVLGCDCSYTLLRQDDSFVPVAAVGGSAAQWDEIRALKFPPQAVAGLMRELNERETVQVCTAAPPTPWAALPRRFGVTVVLYLGLRRGHEIIGIHAAGYLGRLEPFTPVQERIARGSGQLASMALQTVRLVEELERANQLKSDFVATMSHELRTPLNIFMGYNDLLLNEEFGPIAPEQADALHRMGHSAQELLDLICATLDLSRLEKGEVPVELQEVHLPRLLGTLRDELHRWANKPGLQIIWDVSADLPPLRTDVSKLSAILRNLLSNAVKFTNEGTVTVRARPRDGGVEISVADTGVGIAAESLPIIFEPFRQGESAMTRTYGGVGLGLYVVQRLLELLGGTIAVETEVGRGSTFRVSLPRRHSSTLTWSARYTAP